MLYSKLLMLVGSIGTTISGTCMMVQKCFLGGSIKELPDIVITTFGLGIGLIFLGALIRYAIGERD